jgi:hypothetical protein
LGGRSGILKVEDETEAFPNATWWTSTDDPQAIVGTGENSPGVDTYTFEGDISHLAVFNEVKTKAEIKSLIEGL